MASPECKKSNAIMHTNKQSRAAQVLLHVYKRLPGVKAKAAGLTASCRRVRGPRAVRAAW